MKISLRGHVGAKGQTGVVKQGGTDVDFSPAHSPVVSLPFRVRTSDVDREQLLVDVCAMDWDAVGDHDLIGRGVVDVSHALRRAVANEEMFCALADDSGKPAGVMVVSITRASVGVDSGLLGAGASSGDAASAPARDVKAAAAPEVELKEGKAQPAPGTPSVASSRAGEGSVLPCGDASRVDSTRRVLSHPVPSPGHCPSRCHLSLSLFTFRSSLFAFRFSVVLVLVLVVVAVDGGVSRVSRACTFEYASRKRSAQDAKNAGISTSIVVSARFSRLEGRGCRRRGGKSGRGASTAAIAWRTRGHRGGRRGLWCAVSDAVEPAPPTLLQLRNHLCVNPRVPCVPWRRLVLRPRWRKWWSSRLTRAPGLTMCGATFGTKFDRCGATRM